MAKLSGTVPLISFCKSLLSDGVFLYDVLESVNNGERNPKLIRFEEILSSLTLESDKLAEDFVDDYISYLNIIDQKYLSMGIFLMSEGTSFPIHDHPSMFGVSHLISGRISYSNYDIVSVNGSYLKYRTTRSGIAEGPFTMYLTPTSGNLHTITAQAPSILLDIFVPNYSSYRPCNYYRQVFDEYFLPDNPEILFRCADNSLLLTD